MRRGLAARLLLLAGVAAGLLLWNRERRPVEMALEIDLTGALPGEISELDVVVRRGGQMIARHDVRYGAAGAPGLEQVRVRATPGEAEVETTLVYPGRPARRSTAQVTLRKDAPARVAPG